MKEERGNRNRGRNVQDKEEEMERVESQRRKGQK